MPDSGERRSAALHEGGPKGDPSGNSRRLVGKRVTGRFFVDEVISHGIHACDYLLACDMDMDPVPGYAFTSWAKGYGDFRPIPDFDTMRIASWQKKTALVVCDVYLDGKDDTRQRTPRGSGQERGTGRDIFLVCRRSTSVSLVR